ncbi:MAG: BON domain-containing protein [Candidatus Competibacteraceae bacterium]
MKQNRNGWVVGAALMMLSLSGCAGLVIGGAATGVSVAHDRRTAGAVVDDQSIEIKASTTLLSDLPDGCHVNVNSYNGAALLTGEVASEEARQQAEDIVRGIEPVRVVYNELVVGLPSTLSNRSNDTLLTTKVKAALFEIRNLPGFDPTRVKITTERKVVYLMGLVRPDEADAAANVASQVSDVKRVVTLFEYIN